MNGIEKIFAGVLLCTCFFQLTTFGLSAQNNRYNSLFSKEDTLISNTKIFGGFVHQHQNFFDKAFSYQGAECGVLFKNKFITGIYAATFISDLKTEIEDKPMLIQMAQAGAMIGRIWKNPKILHAGWQFNTGYFSLNGESNVSEVNANYNSDIVINGLILSPQIYAELNITNWMNFRTGVAYNFYFFEDETIISKSDIQNFSLNFGFIFGKFN